MKYDGDITYNQAHYNYNGIYVVSPQSFNIPQNFGGLNLLSVLLISPPSITSTLVFVDTTNVVVPSGIIDNSETTSSISVVSFTDFGIMEIEKISESAFALASLNNEELYSSGYLAVSIDKNEAYAVSSAQSIILDSNSAGTIDITIISNA